MGVYTEMYFCNNNNNDNNSIQRTVHREQQQKYTNNDNDNNSHLYINQNISGTNCVSIVDSNLVCMAQD